MPTDFVSDYDQVTKVTPEVSTKVVAAPVETPVTPVTVAEVA